MGAEESHEPQPGPTVSAPLRVAEVALGVWEWRRKSLHQKGPCA